MLVDLLGPAPRDFVGFAPLTEPEAIAVYNFTLQYDFNLVIAFHSQGKIIIHLMLIISALNFPKLVDIY